MNVSNMTSYTYTFAAPNTTTDTTKCYTIFNVLNDDDIIPMLPLEYWDFTKYGDSSKHISVTAYYEDSNPFGNKVNTWEWLVGKNYNPDGGTQRTIDAFKKLAKNRSELYQIDTDAKVNPHDKWHLTRKAAEDEMVTVIEELKNQGLYGFCEIDIDGGFLNPYNVVVTESPAFLMRTLSNMAVWSRYSEYLGQGKRVGGEFGFDVPGMAISGYDVGGNEAYAAAKASFAWSSIGGLVHPHTPETYYLIAHNGAKKLP